MDDFDLQKAFLYIYEVYTYARCEYSLAKEMFLDYDSNSKSIKELTIVIIDALIESSAIKLSRITLGNEEISINRLVNKYNRAFREQNTKKVKFNCPKDCLDQLHEYRRHSLAHSDMENITCDKLAPYPLFWGTLKTILDSLAETLDLISKQINGYSIIGKSIETGEYVSLIERNVLNQYNNYRRFVQETERLSRKFIQSELYGYSKESL